MKAGYKVIKHTNGFEVAYINETGTFSADDGRRFATREQAKAECQRLESEDQACRAGERAYAAGYAYACGYHDWQLTKPLCALSLTR